MITDQRILASQAINVYLDLAHQEYQAGRFQNALKHCASVYHQDPNNLSNLLLLTSVFFQLRDYEKSMRYCTSAIRVSPMCAEAYSNLGNVYKERGQLNEAIDCYRKAVALKIEFVDGYINLASALVARGDYEEATRAYENVLTLNPDLYCIRSDYGNVLKAMGRLEEAKDCYARAIQTQPQFALAWSNLGCVFSAQGEIWLAIHYFEKSVTLDPTFIDGYINLGNTFKEGRIFDRAIDAYIRAHAIDPTNTTALSNLASVHFEMGNVDLAIETFRKAISLQPNHPHAYCNLANALKEKGLLDDAEQHYLIALQQCATHTDSLNNLANIKREQGKLEEASQLYQRALAINPDFAACHGNFASLLHQIGKHSEAIHHYKEAIRIAPNYVDVYINLGSVLKEIGDVNGSLHCFNRATAMSPAHAEAHSNLAHVHKDSGNILEAIQYYSIALKLKPEMIDAFCNMAHCLQLICDFSEYESRMARVIQCVETQLAVPRMLPSVHPHHTFLYPLTHQHRMDIARRHADLCAQKNEHLNVCPYKHPNQAGPREPGRRLRVGYVSSDFGNHPTSHLMQSVPGFHNRSKVEIFCYALSVNDGTNFRSKIMNEAEHFIDLSAVPDNIAAAAMIHNDGIDILVNMNGYTKGARNEIFALKPAPIQVMWLGYPGTSGAEYMDYIVTDAVTSPMRLAHAYSEKLAYMPHTFFIGDHAHMLQHLTERLIVVEKDDEFRKDNLTLVNATSEHLETLLNRVDVKEMVREVEVVHGPEKKLISTEVIMPIAEVPTTTPLSVMVSQGLNVSVVEGVPVLNGVLQPHTKASTGEEVPNAIVVTSRQQYALPEDAIVFCNFNQLYKIDPETLETWATILKRVPKAVMWLLRFPLQGEANVVSFFVSRGIEPQRIIFSHVAAKEEHVRRGQLADVCLDTPLCNGHTTGMDILWTGTPMVTLPLETLASRVASSQLYALGVPELVARSRQDYVEKAVRLGTDRNYLSLMRTKVWKARTTSTLFNVKQYCTDIEELFSRMWKRYEEGKPVDHITELTAHPVEDDI